MAVARSERLEQGWSSWGLPVARNGYSAIWRSMAFGWELPRDSRGLKGIRGYRMIKVIHFESASSGPWESGGIWLVRALRAKRPARGLMHHLLSVPGVQKSGSGKGNC